jgi:hypothetical protein
MLARTKSKILRPNSASILLFGETFSPRGPNQIVHQMPDFSAVPLGGARALKPAQDKFFRLQMAQRAASRPGRGAR